MTINISCRSGIFEKVFFREMHEGQNCDVSRGKRYAAGMASVLRVIYTTPCEGAARYYTRTTIDVIEIVACTHFEEKVRVTW